MLRDTKHLKTEVDPLKLGESLAEVSFVGRSNVGKSSLINALCQKKKMAYVSQVPGKTRTINVYEVAPGRWIVDLPGYGYAVGQRYDKERLGAMIEGYLRTRDKLRMIFVIVDAVAGPTKLDSIMINWIKEFSFPYSIIVHKIDKIGPSKLDQRKKDIAAALAIDADDVSWVSSKKNTGIPALQEKVAALLGI